MPNGHALMLNGLLLRKYALYKSCNIFLLLDSPPTHDINKFFRVEDKLVIWDLSEHAWNTADYLQKLSVDFAVQPLHSDRPWLLGANRNWVFFFRPNLLFFDI